MLLVLAAQVPQQSTTGASTGAGAGAATTIISAGSGETRLRLEKCCVHDIGQVCSERLQCVRDLLYSRAYGTGKGATEAQVSLSASRSLDRLL